MSADTNGPAARKVGFLAFLGTNYGSVLQSYGLYRAIRGLGYDCEVVGAEPFFNRYPPPAPGWRERWLRFCGKKPEPTHGDEYESLAMRAVFSAFIRRHFHKSAALPAVLEKGQVMPEAVAAYDAYVCGSDQIWKPDKAWFRASRYLQFAPSNKRVAYAPSVGWSSLPLRHQKNVPLWKRYLGEMTHLSCRERRASDIIGHLTGRPVETVLDPTFLLTPEQWEAAIPGAQVAPEAARTARKPYLFAYVLDTFDLHQQFIKRLAKRLGLRVVWLTGRDHGTQKRRNVAQTCPGGFISLLRGASFVVADGFHGTCLSLNFGRPFFFLKGGVLNNESAGSLFPRIEDILGRMGVSSRVVEPGASAQKITTDMDFSGVRDRLRVEREASLAYLTRALAETTGEPAAKPAAKPPAPKKNRRTVNRVPLDDPDNCTGCGGCRNLCPVDAIAMTPDADGFLQPVVDDARCTRCGICLARCPIRKRPQLFREPLAQAFATWSLDYSVLRKSASGGVFAELARWTFDRGGVAFGAVMDKDFRVRTAMAASMEELVPLQSSKYLQADSGLSFREAKAQLDAGRHVLFGGTSCQIGGLLAYLGGDRDRLLTVDLICGGTPSTAVFRKYLAWRGRQTGSPVTQFKFRSKHRAWGCNFLMTHENGTQRSIRMSPDEFGILYEGKFIQCPACYVCRYRGDKNRIADLTIGDFWGLGKTTPFKHPKTQGVSVVLPNTIKGRIIFQSIGETSGRMFVEERDLGEVFPHNGWLKNSFPRPVMRDAVMRALREKEFETVFSEFFAAPEYREVEQPHVFETPLP